MARDYGTYPKKVEDGEVSQIERSPRRLGFKLSHIRFDQVKFGYIMFGLSFGFDTGTVNFAEWVIHRQNRIDIGAMEITKLMMHSANELFVTATGPSIWRLHCWHLISFC